MGVFADTERVMAAHGRDVGEAFDEPFRMLRNQGQVLGEEHSGDVVTIDGQWDGERLIADSVAVVAATSEGSGPVVGEIMRKTENLLRVQTEDRVVGVEVPDSAMVSIPSIAGDNDVTQLRQHLEIQRMSKSKGNVVNPDELVDVYGADTVRTYLMFAYEWQKGGPWDSKGIVGAHRFIEDVWKLGHLNYVPAGESTTATSDLRRAVHQTIAKVGADMEEFKWNTAIAALMSLRNTMIEASRSQTVSAAAWGESVEVMVKLLAPIAPHVTDELWRSALGREGSIHTSDWPVADSEVARDVSVTMVVQINGKVRARLEVAADISADDAERLAMDAPAIVERLSDVAVRKVIVREPKLVNIVAN